MTHQLDMACSRELSARWCALAERRLDHLTELFESGRWRRYHSERSFLENIQEAKAAVKTWRALARGERIVPDETVASYVSFAVEPAALRCDVPTVTEPDVVLAPELPADSAYVDLDASEPVVAAEEIVLREPPPFRLRIDMAALEQAINFGGDVAEQDPFAELDAIERRYPALRHAL